MAEWGVNESRYDVVGWTLLSNDASRGDGKYYTVSNDKTTTICAARREIVKSAFMQDI